MDVTRGELVEAELDRLVERRHDLRVADEGERPAEAAWLESERRYDARRRAEDRAARLAYHEGQAARLGHTLGSLVAFHEAEKYRDHDQRRSA